MKRPGATRADACAKLAELLGKLRARRTDRLEIGCGATPRASDALRALCAGSISVEEYLTIKLDLAIRPLEGLLRPADLAAVRIAMSERILSEPIWRRVVEELRATIARERPDHGKDDDR